MPAAAAALAAAAAALAVARTRAKAKAATRREELEPSRVAVDRLAASQDEVGVAVREALACVSKALDAYAGKIVVAFNGGKDCLVVLHLVAAECARRGLSLPPVVYFERTDDFPEVTRFMNETAAELRFTVRVLPGGYKPGMEVLRAEGVEASVMGQRKADPYAPPTEFAPTTAGWPAMMRVNPILGMSYDAVWGFLRQGGFKYCRLYDEGYTSLGPVSETKPNPELIRHKQSAFELKGGDAAERAGRAARASGT